MSGEVLVALLSLCGTLIGSLAGIGTANRLVAYRIEQLEKKVERHNRVMERTFALEERMTGAERAILELKRKGEG